MNRAKGGRGRKGPLLFRSNIAGVKATLDPRDPRLNKTKWRGVAAPFIMHRANGLKRKTVCENMLGGSLSNTHRDPVLPTQPTVGFTELSQSGRKSILHLLSHIIRSHVDKRTIHLTFKEGGAEGRKQAARNVATWGAGR